MYPYTSAPKPLGHSIFYVLLAFSKPNSGGFSTAGHPADDLPPDIQRLLNQLI
ncbi:MAG: hypothetical protein JWN01_652 [Patescibacteria group bacterium]|nr:hypothetical protein [Patescibacteria group bacterium]